MAKENKSKYAILGALSTCPGSGYDIKKFMEQSTSNFWNESYGQIYPILNRLAAEGFAARRREKQRGKPDRQIYSLTDKGRQELARWLAIPARQEPFRNELLLKLFLGAEAPVAESITQIEHYQANQHAFLETYRGIEQHVRQELAGHPQLPFTLVTLHYGQHRCRAMLAWCAESIRALKRLEGTTRPRRRRASAAPPRRMSHG